MFTVLVELVVPVPRVPPSHSSPLKVCFLSRPVLHFSMISNQPFLTDAKQARDLVTILNEAKQQIDPRLAEMVRYSGGGGGGRWGGRGGRGGWGGRGRGGGGFTASNTAPIGGNRRW